MVNVITIDREYGSGGSDIARMLGARLEWPVWDERLTSEIARVMECDCKAVEMLEERRDPLYYRLLKAFLRGSAEGVRSVQQMKIVDADCIREAAERVVLAAAAEGRSILVLPVCGPDRQPEPGGARFKAVCRQVLRRPRR